MNYIDRNGKIYENEETQDKILRKLYASLWGRLLLWPLIRPGFSQFAGRLLDSGASRCLIKPFIQKNHIDMSPYEPRSYHSFNDFFTREIKPEERMIDYDETHLVSPADGKISAYQLGNTNRFFVKNTCYTTASLLQNQKLAKRYKNGAAIIIRLSVDDYHRYCYPSDGLKSSNYYIPGVLHTVQPAACETVPVYKENQREYTLIKTRCFGTLLQMEVGALLVGRIKNYQQEGYVKKGHEKGKFEYGGSTIILLVEPDKVKIASEFFENTENGYETFIKMGECIGKI